jgi:succinylarginine dihydrolase
MRLSSDAGDGGVYLFVYGSDDLGLPSCQSRKRFPRQSKLASQLLSQSLKLPNTRCVFAEQTSVAIDAGVFHNDVISTSHENLLIYHEDAFEQEERVIEQLQSQFEQIHFVRPLVIRIARNELPLSEAVATYFFNSQIVTQTDGTWRFLCPSTCQNSLAVQSVVMRLKKEIPRISDFDYVPLHQSMANGGGPACLRLRVSLTPEQLRTLPESARLNPGRLEKLRSLITSEYPRQLLLEDLSRLDFAEHATETAIKLQGIWESTKTAE